MRKGVTAHEYSSLPRGGTRHSRFGPAGLVGSLFSCPIPGRLGASISEGSAARKRRLNHEDTNEGLSTED